MMHRTHSRPLFSNGYPPPRSKTTSFRISHDTEGEFRGLKARKKGRWSVYFNIFGGWLLTLLIVLALGGSILFYSEVMPIMSKMTKREVNTIITGLSIALSITVLKGLNDFVATLRWWILSRHYHSLRKVDLILQAESVSRVIKLAGRTRRFGVHVAALTWLCVILAVQIALALLGLCYSVETHDSLALVVQEGKVLIPDMSTIQTLKILQSEVDSVEAQEYIANSYGQISLAFDTAWNQNLSTAGSIWTASNPLVFCDEVYCKYVFHETSAPSTEDGNTGDDSQDDFSGREDSLIVTTNRTINSTAVCRSWQVMSGGSGREDSITIDAKENGTAEEIPIPVQGGVNQTTFITNTIESCGAGCRIVTAFEAAGANSWYYRCNVTVGQTQNGTIPEHEVSEPLRSIAAASIALQGIEVSSFDDDNVQYKIYPAESTFGIPKTGSGESMALTMVRFAIGTIAICAQSNELLAVDGFGPIKGSRLVVDHWDYISIILVSITLLQLVLGIMTAIITECIVIPEGGPVAVARVLLPITNKLQGRAERSSSNTSEGESSGLWIYKTERTAEEGIYDVFMEEMVSSQNDMEKIESSEILI